MHGIIIGKFAIFHYGHKYLIDTAMGITTKLTVFICTLKSEKIDGLIRYNWINDTYKNTNVNVIHIKDEIPNAHKDNGDDAYKIWVKHIIAHLPDEDKKVDMVIASEHYASQVASYLNCKHLIVDINRDLVPSSSSAILSNPYLNWNYITEIAREYFVKQIGIIDDIKTTNELAKHYKTALISSDENYFYQKINAIKKQANRFIFINIKENDVMGIDMIFEKESPNNPLVLKVARYNSTSDIIKAIDSTYKLINNN